MFDDPLLKMWVSFIAMALMFLSVVITIFTKEKLTGVLRYSLLTMSFVCIVVSGLIVLVITFSGPVPE
ncbi:MAG: DUF2768 domain-containing protein [Alkalicoccus sp.]|jgi:uncharacterized membrane protein|uniref:DUF2768 domain-containing protein n=1 Tax=Alkalicoccus saliphilus TaxID=200989 RepID=A0A2T4UAE1_9BACI|nr:DUF2768 domain-containing protein [Alkalicoccus saliphilus]PTL40378.1 DUF2768 domain-containing protein [Alkalicoccus saliphilus]TVP82842.1 MAG: DUF2768 domain-containing protein [Alkalicoccus sp.]